MEVEDYVEQISDAQGIQGSTVLPDGTIVFAAYRDGEYELCTPDAQLTETDGDLTYPEWLEGRESIGAADCQERLGVANLEHFLLDDRRSSAQ